MNIAKILEMILFSINILWASVRSNLFSRVFEIKCFPLPIKKARMQFHRLSFFRKIIGKGRESTQSHSPGFYSKQSLDLKFMSPVIKSTRVFYMEVIKYKWCNSHFCVFVCFKIPEVIRPYYELITYLIYLSWNEFLSYTGAKNKNSLIHSAHHWKEQNKEVSAFILLCYNTPIFWTLMRTQVVKTSVFGKKIKQINSFFFPPFGPFSGVLKFRMNH